MPFPYPNTNHDRNPECIEAIAELGGRIGGLEHDRARQNGSLDKLVDAVHAQGERLAGMDGKLSLLIVRQAEDRAEVHRLADSDPNLRPMQTGPKSTDDPKEKPRWWYALLGAGLATAGIGGLPKILELLGK